MVSYRTREKERTQGRSESRMYSATTIAKIDQNRRESAWLYRATE